MDIPWEREGSMLRSSAAGEGLVARGILHQLIADFLGMDPDARRGVAIRVAGPDWTLEYGDAEIRELAARPEYGQAVHGDEMGGPPRQTGSARGGSDDSPE